MQRRVRTTLPSQVPMSCLLVPIRTGVLSAFLKFAIHVVLLSPCLQPQSAV